MNILQRYNQFYNAKCAELSHGTPISMKHLQSLTIDCAVKAFARKYNYKESIPVEDLLYLAKELMMQGDEKLSKLAQGHLQDLL